MDLRVVVVLCLISTSLGDFFLHNPRGSNGRLNEANANRNNANRLFDTQNNAKGGYCLGPQMVYYEGSVLQVEFSPGHGCSHPGVTCTIILQYTCGSENADPLARIRDGTSTDTIPDDQNTAAQIDQTVSPPEPRYGMHESYSYYQNCKNRNRNMGLWTADRTIGGPSAKFTRQNNMGSRYAFECPEERDYYPYWHPSPWRDIAVLTDNTDVCQYYQAQSENAKSRNYCQNPSNPGVHTAQNTNATCVAAGNQWITSPAFGIEPPQCMRNTFALDNDQVVPVAPYSNSYSWTLPTGTQETCINNDNCACVLRARYNISSSELAPTGFVDKPNGPFIDSTKNGVNSPIKNDPLVSLGVGDAELELAADTSQFGRVFQDRSHVFKIAARPLNVATANIWNLNVRGKRGNVVQAFPALEYDFSPVRLEVNLGDYIHFQWTGCDTNPAGNAGEGTDQTDRTNIVQIVNPMDNVPASQSWFAANPNSTLFSDANTRFRFAYLDQQNCLTRAQLVALGVTSGLDQDERNCGKLNAADRYFNGGLIEMNKLGTFFYMSTRNNNFSNRGQKGQIVVVASDADGDVDYDNAASSLNGGLINLFRAVNNLF
eukprot:TRINITY_DN10142_c0_g1_i1.p1 TRINITY_DN10142_c0_g1~~TRINITY_DN10142_c0_g1_i1.p1  ORF type:complete len:601 (+),score=114.88 TRINITY_DN10142_c0_g1_i1:33-1835(+)